MTIITLANLAKATEQQIFDQVVLQMIKQGRRSVLANGLCKYRGNDGAMCAAGCLIADDEYKVAFDQGAGNWDSLVEKKIVPSHHSMLIRKLQICHDFADDIEGVLHRMRRLGECQKLNLDVFSNES